MSKIHLRAFDGRSNPLKPQLVVLTREGVAMAGYDPNRPRPSDSGPFIGLPGDPQVDHLDAGSQTIQEDESELVTSTAGEDETSPTLQSVPQAVPPLDRRLPMMAVFGSIGGLVVILLVWRRVMGRHR